MCLHGALCSTLFNLIYNMTSFSKTNILTFDLITGVEGMCKDRYVLACCCIPHSLKLDMQHDLVLKKMKFDF